MPIETRFRHTLAVKRMAPVLDGGGQPVLDGYLQPTVAPTTVATVIGLIQPRTAREIALQSQAGAVVSDHAIYALPNAALTSDAWIECEGVRYDILTISDVAGAGRFVEVSARKVS